MTRRTITFVPHKHQHIAFGFLLSGLMTLVVSAIATLRNLGFDPDFVQRWFLAFITSWPVTFPTVLVVAPVVRRLLSLVVLPPDTRPTSSADASSPQQP
jgi:hypothetical protein